MNKRKERLLEELKSKGYREAFVAELIDTAIPFQIRALRKQRNWTQKELSNILGMKQERISVLEDPNYAKLSLSTLKRLASAFDIGLLVRFVPFSDLVKSELDLSPASLEVKSYKNDHYFTEDDAERIFKNLSYEQKEPGKSGSVTNFNQWKDLRQKPVRTEWIKPTESPLNEMAYGGNQ